MRRAWTFDALCVGVLLLGLTGCVCNPAKRCSTTAECGAGATCTAGLCVLAGTGGAGGNGGQAGQGGAGGTGGSGGGSDPLCASVMCPDSMECRAGACLARFASLEWTAPDAGLTFAATSIPLAAKLTMVSGAGGSYPSNLVLVSRKPDGSELASSLAHQSAGVYLAQLPTPDDGDWSITLTYADAGLTAGTRSFSIDHTGPVFIVEVQSPPIRTDGGALSELDVGFEPAWKRDESAIIRVKSFDTDVNAASVTGTLFGMLPDGGVDVTSTLSLGAPATCTGLSTCPNGLGYCMCFQANLSAVAMPGFRGTLAVQWSGADVTSNPGTFSSPPGVKVTRLRWARTLSASAAVTGTPALAGNGAVFVGTTNNLSGNLFAISHSGAELWNVSDAGAVATSPVVVKNDAGTEMVVVASYDQGGTHMSGYSVSVGAKAMFNCDNPSGTHKTLASPVVGGFGGHFNVVGLLNEASNGRILAYRPFNTTVGESCAGLATNDRLTTLSNLVLRGNRVSVPLDDGSVHRYSFSSVWSEDSAAVTSLAGAGTIQSLAINSADGGTNIVGGTAGVGTGVLFEIGPNGGTTTWRFPTTGKSSHWNPAVGKESIFVGANPTTLRSVLFGGVGNVDATAAGQLHAAPVLGADGRIYTVDSSAGALQVWRSNSNGILQEWSQPLGTGFEASPTIDCNRAHVGKGGVLYAASATGTLYSILVDAKGIDTTAPWPKYQHDPRNTGNADTSLSEFVCP